MSISTYINSKVESNPKFKKRHEPIQLAQFMSKFLSPAFIKGHSQLNLVSHVQSRFVPDNTVKYQQFIRITVGNSLRAARKWRDPAMIEIMELLAMCTGACRYLFCF